MGPNTVLPASLPLFKTLCKILCWNPHRLLHHIFLNLIDGLKSYPFQGWFKFWEKPEISGHQIWAVGGLNHLGDLMFCPKKNCTRRDAWAGALSWWSCQSPAAHSSGHFHHISSLNQWRTLRKYFLLIVCPGEHTHDGQQLSNQKHH